MSYDLSFRFRDRRVEEGAIREYFQGRANFECSEAQAWYSNETTGVYFSFEFGLGTPDPDDSVDIPAPDPAIAPVAFNINYFRPHYFALEAERELTPLVRHFDLLVNDPQSEGMGEGQYTPQGFLRGWNAGNLLGFRAACHTGEAPPPFSLPTATLEGIWRWNFTRVEREKAMVEDIYVPRVFLFNVSGALKTGVAWGDAIPILMPEVDVVLAPRKVLAPRSLFKKHEDIAFFSMRELLPILSRYPAVKDHLPARRLFYSDPPRDLVRLFRSKGPKTEDVKALAMDQVLNIELLNQASASSA